MADNSVKITIITDAGNTDLVLNNIKRGLKDFGDTGTKTSDDFIKQARDMGLAITSWANIVSSAFGKVQQAFDLVKGLAEFADVKQNFAATASSVGVSADQMLDRIRNATENTVQDMDLLKAATSTMAKGVVTDVDQMARLFEIAKAKSELGFGGTIEVFEKMVDAINKGTSRSLVDLGFLPESMGRARDGADLLMKKSEALSVVLQQGGKDIARVASAGDQAGDAFQRFDVALGRLKESFSELLPVITPFVEEMTRGVNAIQDFLRAQGMLATKNAYVGETTEALTSKLAEQKKILADTEKRLTIYSRAAGPSGYTINEANPVSDALGVESIRAANHEAAKQIKLIESAIEKTQQLTVAKEKHEKQEKTLAETVVKSHDTHQKGAKATRIEVDKLAERLAKLADEANIALVHEIGGKGVSSMKEATAVFQAATAAVAGFGMGLKDGVTNAGKLDQVMTDAADKAAGIMSYVTGAALGGGNQKYTGTEAEKSLRVQIEKPLGRIFADALLDGAKSGDWLQSIGTGLKQVVTEAFSQKFPVMNSGGGINIGNLGMNLAAGFVMNRLTGTGGLFSNSRVINGAEVPGQAAGINSQVNSARAGMSSLLGAGGLSASTYAELNALAFGTASYSTSKSGDGVFSKKTTTYNLDAAAAQKTLTEYAALSAKAQAEATFREWEKAMVSLKDPSMGLQMTMDDLRESIRRLEATGKEAEPAVRQLQLSLAEAEKQMKMTAIARNSGYNQLYATNPYAAGAAAGTSLDLGWFGSMSGSDYAAARMAGGVPKQFSINGESANQIMGRFDRKIGAAAYSAQAAGEYAYGERLANADGDLQKTNQILSERKNFLAGSLGNIEAIITTTSRRINDETLSIEEQEAAYTDYQTAVTGFYNVKSEIGKLERTIAANEKTIAENATKTAEGVVTAAEDTISAQELARQAQEKLLSRLAFQEKWLSNAISGKSALGDRSQFGGMSELINSGGVESSSTINQEVAFLTKSAEQNYVKARRQAMGETDFAGTMIVANAQADFFKGIMDASMKILEDAAADMDTKRSAAERFLRAQDEFYGAKLDALDAELANQAEIKRKEEEVKAKADELKAKQEQLVYDYLGNALTAIGEITSNRSGQQVIVVSPGSPDAVQYAQLALDAANGLAPEVKASLQRIVSQTVAARGSYFRGV